MSQCFTCLTVVTVGTIDLSKMTKRQRRRNRWRPQVMRQELVQEIFVGDLPDFPLPTPLDPEWTH